MSSFVWNVNFLVFWRIAWLRKGASKLGLSHWNHVGRLYFKRQSLPYKFYIEPKVKKLKNLIAKFRK